MSQPAVIKRFPQPYASHSASAVLDVEFGAAETAAVARGPVLRGRPAPTVLYPVKLPEPPPAPPPEAHAHPEEKPAEKTAPCLACREEVEAEWAAKLAKAVAQARAEAYDEGHAAAHASLQDEIEGLKTTVAAGIEHLDGSRQERLDQSESLLAELAFALAEAVLEAPLPEAVRGLTEKTLLEALDLFREESTIDVTLHPVDLLRLQEHGVAAQVEATYPRLRWRADPDLAPGDWTAASPEAAVRRLQSELLDTLKTRFALLPSGDAQHPDALPSE